MRVFFLILATVWLTACQLPSERVVVGDNSAGLSFRVLNESDAVYEVYVDGLLMGNARDFAEGVAILKVLPGSHVVRVLSKGKVVSEEQFYVASGANKVLTVK